MNKDTIYRQDAVREIANHLGVPAENWMKIAEEWLRDVPSAEPEEIALHESCTDCPLYDHERHSCPRFNKVIPETLRELQSAQPRRGQWIKRKGGALGYNCSCCGKSDISNHFNYCPNCGAEMERRQE